MTAQLLGLQSQERNWISMSSTRNVNNPDSTTRTSQTKLLFNKAVPISAINRATRVGPPAPIVIERLLPRSEMHEGGNSLKSSRSFTVLSEERLQAAVKLAKKDLRRRYQEPLPNTSPKPLQEDPVFETSYVELFKELVASPGKQKSNLSKSKEKKAPTNAFKKNPTSLMARVGQSPPTKDPGLKQMETGKHGLLSTEIRRLQNELETYIRKVEELANRGERLEESLEPEEQSKLETRRQKQAARSGRLIYVLQRQVKEIQDDIEKLRGEKMWETKKSLAINRLAAVHRGALRALQVIIQQLSDRPHSWVPSYYKELATLIRQLSLCSAKVEVDQGSALPETALDILQKLEVLDSALSKQEMLEKMQAQSRPRLRKSPQRSSSPTVGPKSLGMLTTQGSRKHANPTTFHGRKKASQNPKTASHGPESKREVLMAGLQKLDQQREPKVLERQSQPNTNYQRKQHAVRRKADVTKMRDAGFRQSTVSSQLRVNQLPQKEKSVPWIPTSPHSPPQQRAPQRGRPEPRCLFSPVKPSPSPPTEQQAGGQREAERRSSSTKKKEAQNEAIRKAYQEKMSAQRANRLSDEEALRMQRLRSEVVLQNQWTEEAEQRARERSQQLSDKTQEDEPKNKTDGSRQTRLTEQAADREVDNGTRLSESQSSHDAWAAETGEQPVDIAWCGPPARTLESMLLRMEEIQREEEEVRRRFASIAYSDPLYWDRSRTAGSQSPDPGSRPDSPQPIRLTRPVLKQTSSADIIVEKPIETGVIWLCSLFTRTG